MNITYKVDNVLRTTDLYDNDDFSMEAVERGGLLKATLTAKKEMTLVSVERRIKHAFGKNDLIFANGYQSWTETTAFARGEHLNDLSRLPRKLVEKFGFCAYGSQFFTPMPKGTLLAFDLFYVEGEHPIFFGSYNYRSAYLMIRPDPAAGEIRLESDVAGRRLAPGESFSVFHYMMRPSVKEGLDEYFSAFTPKTTEKHFGYTSWYNHYQNINESLMEQALDEVDERFDLFQIDDGFEPFVGDWMETDEKKFPNGLSPLVEKIHKKGLLAGIWLAPFAAERNSALYREHPEYLARDERGNPILAGGNWSGFSPLDLNVPDAVDHIRWVLRRYVELGFDFFKLDFLYAASLLPLAGKTRAETAEFAYSLLCEELEGKLILGCGAVLSNAYEKFDYMRIGPDVSLKFDDVAYMRHFHPERISTKVTLCNTIFRSPMNGRVFGNDPDVFLLRDDKISLSEKQRYALSLINALFGSLLMTSDNPKHYDEKKKAVLDRILSLSKSAEVLDYERRGKTIRFSFREGDLVTACTYHIKKGVITRERQKPHHLRESDSGEGRKERREGQSKVSKKVR